MVASVLFFQATLSRWYKRVYGGSIVRNARESVRMNAVVSLVVTAVNESYTRSKHAVQSKRANDL